MSTIFFLLVLIFSVIVHEVAHGLAALSLGDPTAKYAGRLTLNPIKHIDILGSIIVPLICALLPGNLMFGWAKPVPVNPYNLKYGKWGDVIVSFAGPLSNIIIFLICGLSLRFFGDHIPQATAAFLLMICITNIVLAIYNLIPVSPLDGSHILFAFLPERFQGIKKVMEAQGFLFAIIFALVLWQYFTPLIYWILALVIGS
ncbi:MAG: site-2 protease family protein [bacterium]